MDSWLSTILHWTSCLISSFNALFLQWSLQTMPSNQEVSPMLSIQDTENLTQLHSSRKDMPNGSFSLFLLCLWALANWRCVDFTPSIPHPSREFLKLRSTHPQVAKIAEHCLTFRSHSERKKSESSNYNEFSFNPLLVSVKIGRFNKMTYICMLSQQHELNIILFFISNFGIIYMLCGCFFLLTFHTWIQSFRCDYFKYQMLHAFHFCGFIMQIVLISVFWNIE